MSVGRFLKPSAAPSRATPNSLTCQKMFNLVLNSHVHLLDSEAILSNWDYIALLSCDHRHHRLCFAARRQYEGDTMLPDCVMKATPTSYSPRKASEHRLHISIYLKCLSISMGYTILTQTVLSAFPIFPTVTWSYKNQYPHVAFFSENFDGYCWFYSDKNHGVFRGQDNQ